tara:strand:+ start:1110 stop:3557 length:2448 start_codon:yes stop_codon:yes gene_type:complete
MDKVEYLLSELSIEEAISIISGSDAWHSTGVERLSIPRLKLTDGPNGARGDGVSGKTSACFPCGIALGSTWDIDLLKEIGRAIAREAKSKDADVLLGPTINLHRHPLGGRHFECYSEDPILTGKLAVSFVQGVQSQKVAACLKHFVGNDTEFERHNISSNIDPRTLREMYLLPFELGIKKGGAMSVMSAYNQLNNKFCSSHEELLKDILKEEWVFPGFVVSDWGAALDTEGNAKGGLDLIMPGPSTVWGENLLKVLKEKKITEEEVFDKARRLLRVADFTGRLDNPEEKEETSQDLEADRLLIRKTAADSMVLLKNENLLPLNKSKIKTLALIGPNAEQGQFIGGGSASVKPHYVIHPPKALKEYLGEEVKVVSGKGCHTYKYLPPINKEHLTESKNNKKGYLVEFFEGDDLGGKVLASEVMSGSKFWALNGFGVKVATKLDPPSLSARFTAKFKPDITGEHVFEIISIGSARLRINGKEIIDNWTSQEKGEAFFGYGSAPNRSAINLNKDEEYFIEVDYKWLGRFPAIQIGLLPPDKENLLDQALSLSKNADAVILIAGTSSDWETEGNDRSEISLPSKQDELIHKICAANPNTVVIINTGSPCSMPWLDKARAVLLSWFPGQEYGRALTDILFGEINPSGKLPTTFPKLIEDTPAFQHYPGSDLQMNYEEGLYIGYRWYEKKKIEPLFHFGYGLSYTKFEYSSFKITPPEKDSAISFKMSLKNVGKIYGKEVVQCYVSVVNSKVDRPNKELKLFQKVGLEPGESKDLEFYLTERDLAYWDENSSNWLIEPAEYKILVGSSSNDIKLKGSVWLG